jgi:hypothetical protein
LLGASKEIAARFHFSPGYLSLPGGMISRPDLHALLLITSPGGAQSFDYDDYWDGDALVYTARGKTGNQTLVGQNWDLANNVRTNYVFEVVSVVGRFAMSERPGAVDIGEHGAREMTG